MAPLPARRALAPAGRAGAARPRGPGCGRGLLRCPRRRAPRGAGRGAPPVARTARAGPARARLRRRRGAPPPARPRRAPGCRSPRRCSTSARWPGSATSRRTRPCGSSASRRSPRSAPSTTTTLARLVATARRLLLAKSPAVAARARHDRRRPGAPGPLYVYGRTGRPCRRCRTPIAERTAGDRHPADDLLVPDLPADAPVPGRSAEPERSDRPDRRVSSRPMCEHFIARASEPFRLDELWPFTEKLERFGIAGFGWGAAWLDAATARLGSYRDLRAFRDDPARETVGATETTSALVHLRRPSRLSTLTAPRHPAVRRPGRPLRVQPQRRPARLQGPARDVPRRGPHPRPRRHRGRRALARGRVAAGRVPGARSWRRSTIGSAARPTSRS